LAHPLAAWLRLTLTPGIGGETQRALLKRFGSPEQIYAASRSGLAAVGSEKAADRLLNTDNAAAVDAALAWAAQPGSRILTLGDAAYPPQLLETPDPPTVLYVRGRVELLSRPCVAVVGSRNCTPQGAVNAEAFARVLSEAGLTVVSGLALGIDAAAHRGALRGEGSTVAVIGTGPDRIYPARNRDLAHDVAGQGALVSEFPVGTPALAANFPRRNRVISGLARAVLVVEAAERSGSLITARLAADQGRDVFAIPGSIHSPLSKGCHRLIKQGAKLVDDARDVLDELGMLPPTGAGAPVGSAGASDPLLEQMGFDPCDVDALAERSGSAPEEVVAALLRLELDGWVASLPGGRYQRLR
jgi:DNA processing protein